MASRLIDGTGRSLSDLVVFIEGEKITRIVPAAEAVIAEGVEVIDTSGKTLMPGLIDDHVHVAFSSGDPREYDELIRRNAEVSVGTLALRGYVNARRHLEAGVTTIRDDRSRAY